jgi:hypothetical protein
MKILLYIILLFDLTSCALHGSITATAPRNISNTQVGKSDNVASYGLSIRNSTRGAAFYLPYEVTNGILYTVIVDATNVRIPYFLKFTNNPGKCAVIRDQNSNIIQSVKISYNKYERIWQSANLEFQTGTNTVELSVSNVSDYQAKSFSRKRASSAVSGGVTFLAQGGWQSFAGNSPNAYNTRYNYWMDFLVSNISNLNDISVVVTTGPDTVQGNTYHAYLEPMPLNGVPKYGIDIVSGAGYQCFESGIANGEVDTGAIEFDLYINGNYASHYSYDLINMVTSNYQITYINKSYWPNNSNYQYIGYDDVSNQCFIAGPTNTPILSTGNLYEVPCRVMGYKFYDGFWNIRAGQSKSTVDNLFGYGPIICWLQGINTPNLTYTDPNNSACSVSFDNTSINSTVDIVNRMVAYSPKQSQILICSSHGGLRGMAYINQLGSNANRVQGIITIDSPIKGIELLRGGVAALGPKITHEVGILFSGAESMLAVVPAAYLDPIIFAAINANTNYIAESLNLTSGTNTASEIYDIATGNVPAAYFSSTVLNQMDPQGDFAQKYLGAGNITPIADSNYNNLAVAAANNVINSINAVNETFSPILPSNVLVGEIVGHNNDPMYIAGMPGEPAYETAVSIKNDISDTLYSGYGWVLLWTALWEATIVNYPLGAWYGDRANDILAAYDWVTNYVNNTGDLLGDRDNDCLIAARSQQRTIAETGGTPIELNNYIRNIPDEIHNQGAGSQLLDKDHHPMIWGQGGTWGQATNNLPAVSYGNATPIIAYWFGLHSKDGWAQISTNISF